MALTDNAWYVDNPMFNPIVLGTAASVSGATASITTTIAVPAGSLIVVVTNESGGTASGTLSDGTNTYSTGLSNQIGAVSGGWLTVFFVANASLASSSTITFTKHTSGNVTLMQAFYLTGIATSTPQDSAVTAVATGNSTTPAVTSGTPATNSEFLLGLSVNSGTNNTPGAAVGWNTLLTQVGVSAAGLGTFAGASDGGLAPVSFSDTITSGQWTAAILGFKPAAAKGGYSGVNGWAPSTTQVCGNLIRQSALPAVNSERVFVCTASTSGTGTTGATEPSWAITRGAPNIDNTVTWTEATGVAALNGDLTNTPAWSVIKNTAISVGQVIQSGAGDKVLICTTSGTAGNGAEPTWSAFTNAGATTVDNGATWTTIAAVPSGFGKWAAPHARLTNSLQSTWGQPGNSFFVASEHSEAQSTAITINPPGTYANPNFMYCTDKTNAPPTSSDLTTGGQIATVGSTTVSISILSGVSANAAYFRGLTFYTSLGFAAAGNASMTVANNNCGAVFENCAIVFNNTAVSTRLVIGEGTILTNTTVQFNNASQAIFPAGSLYWKNTAPLVVGSVLPTTLVVLTGGSGTVVVTFEGLDLSNLGSGHTIFGNPGSPIGGNYILKDCKLGASVTVAAALTTWNGDIYNIRSDSANDSYRQERYNFYGSQVVETTIIRTGGASDGTTGISWKIVTTANSKWLYPFQCIPITIWNSFTGGTHTVTVYGIWGGGAVPNNDQIWADVEYLGTSGNPLGVFATATKANNLASGSALSTDTSTWGGSTTPFKITLNITPTMIGYLNIYVKAATPSTTFYIDPAVGYA